MEVTGSIKNASFKVLAHTSHSQIQIHVPFGGVYPMLAKREHIKNLPVLLKEALRKARISIEGGLGSVTTRARGIFQQKNIRAESERNPGFIDLIAITYGPGLEPALWTGITFAQDLAKEWKVPVIPVNHMEGHIFSVFAKRRIFSISNFQFPMLALLVSGGHTELVLSKKWLNYKIIGQTLDDAVGEAFDKVARMLGLPYPGGPEISALTEDHRNLREGGLGSVTARARGIFQQKNIRAGSAQVSLSLPRPMLHSKNFDFSFSGLKTAVLYLIKKIGKLDKETKAKIALEFQNAAIECLIHKTKKAIEKYKIKTLIVGGGVSCNEYLRRELKKVTRETKVKLLMPEKQFTGDNSLMIGIAGYMEYIKNKKKVPKPGSIKAIGNLSL